ncbi:hypothetical protein KQX54_006412 [Cotesia glomerata]|uniref:Uncharacterized protein n=1 Tax=Cotesia glomerata TaxID=32391 RepID=A0AAV7J4L5_COTGL|nr:hypothetical protein KQX54_006412 [Cotesia glomerata]
MDVEAKQVQRIGPVETQIQRSAYYKRYETRGERARGERIRPGASPSVAACMRRDVIYQGKLQFHVCCVVVFVIAEKNRRDDNKRKTLRTGVVDPFSVDLAQLGYSIWLVGSRAHHAEPEPALKDWSRGRSMPQRLLLLLLLPSSRESTTLASICQPLSGNPHLNIPV